MVGQYKVAFSVTLPDFDPGLERIDEAALGLLPERVRREPFLDPDAVQGIPVPPYAAFRGFFAFSFLGVLKKPSSASLIATIPA